MRRLIGCFLLLSTVSVQAIQINEIMTDPVLEKRARDLSAEVRCMVCQNQSIDESDAPLARDLRLLLRERLAAGDTNAQIKNFLVERYGAFVLLKPPLTERTWFLWAGPFLILIAGSVGTFWSFRRRPG